MKIEIQDDLLDFLTHFARQKKPQIAFEIQFSRVENSYCVGGMTTATSDVPNMFIFLNAFGRIKILTSTLCRIIVY